MLVSVLSRPVIELHSFGVDHKIFTKTKLIFVSSIRMYVLSLDGFWRGSDRRGSPPAVKKRTGCWRVTCMFHRFQEADRWNDVPTETLDRRGRHSSSDTPQFVVLQNANVSSHFRHLPTFFRSSWGENDERAWEVGLAGGCVCN